jgi:hypothetical protein
MQVIERGSLEPDAAQASVEASIEGWIAELTADSRTKNLLQSQLDSLKDSRALLGFIHRFLLFNDALAARVPFLSGLIHLKSNFFVDSAPETAYCQQRNALVSAYVALAAADEYEMHEGTNLVHQHLSQEFLRGALAFYGVEAAPFDRAHPVPDRLQAILGEVRSVFLDTAEAPDIFAALGFHIGLEYFATEEFCLLDNYLRSRHPDLTESLLQDKFAYSWVQIHTVVEVHHYQAGLRAVSTAVTSYRDPAERPAMLARARAGFDTFVDLQRRFYSAILDDGA